MDGNRKVHELPEPRSGVIAHESPPYQILPEQFFRVRDTERWIREQALMAAILEDAIHCLGAYVSGQSHITRPYMRETLEWLSVDSMTYVFSFCRICEVLDLDPQKIRRRIQPIIERVHEKLAIPRRVGRRPKSPAPE